jgi:hypothetical protein
LAQIPDEYFRAVAPPNTDLHLCTIYTLYFQSFLSYFFFNLYYSVFHQQLAYGVHSLSHIPYHTLLITFFINMHFTFFFVASLAACATALPNRRPGGFQNFQPGGQGDQNNGLPEGQNGNVDAQPNNKPDDAVTQPQVNQAPPAPQVSQVPAAQEAPPDATAAPSDPSTNANDNTVNDQGALQNDSFDAALVPEFGVEAGQNPDGTGNCSGNGGKLIPCQCPPDRDAFIEKVSSAVAAGNSEGVPVEFPTDDSSASAKARIQTAIIVLQNLNGKGVGCPAAATTFLDQQKAA